MTFHKANSSYETYPPQTTIGKEYPIEVKPKGLKELYDALPHGLKEGNVAIYSVFVVPGVRPGDIGTLGQGYEADGARADGR